MRRAAILLLLASAAAAALAGDRLGRIAATRPASEDLLYLPNGEYLKIVSLGQAPVLADAIYLWAIQYYSEYDRRDRYRYVEHVFGDVIPKLDPHYTDPYWLGALILIVEAHDLEAGLRVLDEGFAANPSAWILPYLAGWECARVKQYQRAAAYFEGAESAPGSPPLVRRMRAGMLARAGDLDLALRLWREVLDDPASDPAARAISERQIRDLAVRRDLEALQSAVRAFQERRGRLPARLEDLVTSGAIGALPLDPGGHPYLYDRRTGAVSSAAGRVLGSP